MRMTTERARAILKIHPEFQSLSDVDQYNLWSKNNMNAVALTGALLNTCMSGKNQLKNVLGHLVRGRP